MMTGFVDFQYQFGIKKKILRPFVGFLFHFKSGYFLYGGIVLPIELSKRLIIQPSFAPGLYLNGDGLDLGFPIEFRTAFALIVKIKERFYLGLEFAHISNASIFDADNPGLETLGLLFRFSLVPTKQQDFSKPIPE
jgi:lipid A 3-O-deacylase